MRRREERERERERDKGRLAEGFLLVVIISCVGLCVCCAVFFTVFLNDQTQAKGSQKGLHCWTRGNDGPEQGQRTGLQQEQQQQ